MDENDLVSTESASIDKTMPMVQRNYWRNPEILERYSALLKARKNGAPAPRHGGSVDTEKQQIEAAMKDCYSDYFRGPRNPDGETEMAARYRQILEEEAETARDFMAQRDAANT